jgi:two-component system chemotaxis sensor kinase CheA
MNELMAQFVTEGRELLQAAGDDLLALERAPADREAINRLFRSIHTLKGSSGLFDAKPLTQILHAAEDIFQAVRELAFVPTPELVDLALAALDQVGQWIEYLDRHETLPDDAGPIAKVLVAELRTRFGRREGEVLGKPSVPVQADSASAMESLRRWFSEDALIGAAAELPPDGSIALVSYLPEAGCFYKGEDPLHLAMQIPGLLAFNVEISAPWPVLSRLDPFTCNLGFRALSTADPKEIEALFRYVPEQVTITALPAAAMDPGRARAATKELLPAVALALVRWQIELLDLTAAEEEFAGRVGAAVRVAANALRFGRLNAAATRIEAAGAEALATGRTDELIAAASGTVDAGSHPANTVGSTPLPGPIGQASVADAPERMATRTLRVDQEKVDALMNLVGELVVAKNSLPFLARRAEHQFGLRELGREIKDEYGVIDRVAQELQRAVMSVRMMPVGQVFQRFPRLVRDLARKLGKQVVLTIEGEETEADKNVIEGLFDPLLHMVRNSLDHGVETPQERIIQGKTPAATVKLLARHDGDHVVIEVVDDGRGIDPELIKRKAYERGLLDEARLATIADDEATMLVFAAGFSTADAVSDVSGRGVGMDVVRSVVEKAGGRIAMTSAKGKGTTVRLDLPLSMAVSRVMTVALDDRLFAIPMELIHETVKVPRRDVVLLKENEAFVLRDHVVPLVHLGRLLDLPVETAGAGEVAVLVVRLAGQTIGLGISAFGECMDVILKPLEGMLAKVGGYLGTALLGDGQVLLVLDLEELIQ